MSPNHCTFNLGVRAYKGGRRTEAEAEKSEELVGERGEAGSIQPTKGTKVFSVKLLHRLTPALGVYVTTSTAKFLL